MNDRRCADCKALGNGPVALLRDNDVFCEHVKPPCPDCLALAKLIRVNLLWPRGGASGQMVYQEQVLTELEKFIKERE